MNSFEVEYNKDFVTSFEVVYNGEIYIGYDLPSMRTYVKIVNRKMVMCNNSEIDEIEKLYLISLREEKLKRILND